MSVSRPPSGSSRPGPVTDESVLSDNTSDEIDSDSSESPGMSSMLEGSHTSSKKLSTRKLKAVDTAGLPSVQRQQLERLQAQKADTLKKAGSALKKLGQRNLIDRALGVLNQEAGAAAKEQDQIVITVSPPPDFKAVSVFPPDPDIDPAELARLQKIALDALAGYQGEHKNSDLSIHTLNKEVKECRTELARIQNQITKFYADEPDWKGEFKALKKQDCSFEVKDKDGHYVLTETKGVPAKPKKNRKKPVAAPKLPPEPSKSAGKPHSPKQTEGNKFSSNGRPVLPSKKPVQTHKYTTGEGCRFPEIRLLGAGGNQNGFSDIYDKQHVGTGMVGSVNAGTDQLYVGGGTINKAFGEALTGSGDFNKNGFANYHAQLAGLPQDSRGYCEPDMKPGRAMPGIKYSLCKPAHGNVGHAYVHIFSDDACPYNNPENRAMIYIVPPNGNKFPSKQAFLNAVEDTAANSLELVQEAILRTMDKYGNPIEIMRACRFSSGNYAKEGVTGAEVATAIHRGYQRACQAIVTRGERVLVKTIEYEDGSQGLFSRAGIQAQAATS